MPELPEVETVRRGLAPSMEGARIQQVELRRENLRFPFPDDFAKILAGSRINSLSRRAKYLLCELDNGHTVIMHLGMSGSFRLIEMGEASTPVEFHHSRSGDQLHDHVVIHLAEGKRSFDVVYNDPRRFGFMDLTKTSDLLTNRFLAELGAEPTGNTMDGKLLAALFAGKSAPLKAALLDQKLIAGLGNIYVCEALWRSGLSPLKKAGAIVNRNGSASKRCNALAVAIRDVIGEAIEAGGSTLRNHRLADGSLGYFQHAFQVYDREGQKCETPDCNGTVRRIVQSGRSTFYCPRCQR
ncbi:MAG: bifunctional DNA-formamidopyrimidine glycosylase/DNA-(apurinic or apyrimidinic site) lyase [Rhizobiaceae bacterium]